MISDAQIEALRQLPIEIRNHPQARFGVWRYEYNGSSKPTKVPYQAIAGRLERAKTTDPNTWGNFHTAIQILSNQLFDGIGFALTDSNIAAFDIDDCRNPETGEIDLETYAFIQRVNSYTEITPSGTGVRVLGVANGEHVHRKLKFNATVTVEVYRRARRYITLTGNQIPGSPSILANIDQHIDATVARLDKRPKQSKIEPTPAPPHVVLIGEPDKLADDDVLNKCFNETTGEKFKELYNGRWRQFKYDSWSEAELAFCDFLPHHTNNPEQVKRIWKNSPLWKAGVDAHIAGQRKKNLLTHSKYVMTTVNESFNDQRNPKVQFNLSGRQPGIGHNNPPPSPPGLIESVRASDIKQRPIDWIWRGRLARGKLTLIGGDPDLGKSQIGVDAIARITHGSPWPDGGNAPVGNCLILSAEDGVEDTIVPRLDRAGAVLDSVHILNMVIEKGTKRSFNLKKDLNALGQTVERIGNVTLIMIDPITAYMGDGDSHKTTDVRATLEPLSRFAEHYRIAILAITHPPKAMVLKAIHAFTGSFAFIAAARIGFVVYFNDKTDRTLVLPVKNNIGPKLPGLAYQISPGLNSKGIDAPRVEWDEAPVHMTADDALRAEREANKKDSAIDTAKAFLQTYLANGPKPANELEAAAKAAGISERTLNRARIALGIKSDKLPGLFNIWVTTMPTS